MTYVAPTPTEYLQDRLDENARHTAIVEAQVKQMGFESIAARVQLERLSAERDALEAGLEESRL